MISMQKKIYVRQKVVVVNPLNLTNLMRLIMLVTFHSKINKKNLMKFGMFLYLVGRRPSGLTHVMHFQDPF